MKKLLLGILLGFILNSGLRSLHDHLWWKTEASISNEDMNRSHKQYGYYQVIEERQPVVLVLKHLLVYPSWETHGEDNYRLVIKYP